MNFWEGFILFFAFQSFWLAFLILFSKKGKKAAKWLWFIFLMLFSYNIFHNVLYWSKFDPLLDRQLSLVYFIPMALYGPLFFVYNQMIVGKWKPRTATLLLLASPLLFVLVAFGKYYVLPVRFRQQLSAQGELKAYFAVDPIYADLGLSIVLFFFGVLSYYYHSKHYRNDVKNGSWIKYLNMLFLLFCTAWIVYAFLAYFDLLTNEQDYIITIFMILFVLAQSYLVYKKSDILVDWKRIRSFRIFLKYGKTGMSEKVSLEFKEKLQSLMEREKPYLNPELKLDDLSDLLGISRHHTSQVINQHFGKGFFDFINEYRVREAQQIFLEQKGSSLSTNDVLYNVGFNNKASFYKAFKKFVGTSPRNFVDKAFKTA